jgi:tetratricopeptide (TPR) repeat protein
MAKKAYVRTSPATPLCSLLTIVIATYPLTAEAEPPLDKPLENKLPTLADARELLMAGSYAEAEEAFRNVLQQPPPADVGAAAQSGHEGSLGIAECWMHTGRYADAITRMSLLSNRSAKSLHLLAQLHLRTGQYGEAEMRLREAIELDKRHAGARRLLGELQEYVGQRDEAIETYRWFDRQMIENPELPKDPAWITDAAIGFYRFSLLTGTDLPRRTQHVLHEMLQAAYTRLDRTYWPARIAAGNLLHQKFNDDEEDGSVSEYKAALRTNPHLPEALVGIAEVAAENWAFEEVEKQAEWALEINPRFAPAFHVLAKKFILERRYGQAAETAGKALAINPNDLLAMSLLAAASACRYDETTVKIVQEKVAALNPRCTLFHRTMADALAGIRQFEPSEREYLRAIELDPTDANARTELGMMYMQWGPEDKARDALDAAWVLDPYNERTKFTLELLDRLRRFARHETAHFIIKFDPEKDPGLGEYVASYLEPIYETVTSDFEAPLKEKTIIEFFPSSRAFGVRITGKPWIHTVGASTGQVIALATPRESTELMGHYNLAQVLKHEFTHTVTLAATENRIPHWFTEGLAVYEEDSARPFVWCELLADAIRGDRLFTLESIDWGFQRPRRPMDRQLAYAQSEWMVEFIIDRFGYDAISALIKDFRAGKTQPDILPDRFKLTLEEFDAEFRKWAQPQVPTWPCPFDLTPSADLDQLRAAAQRDGATAVDFGRLARAEFDENDEERAEAAAARALDLDENDRFGLEVLSKVLLARLHDARTKAETREVIDRLTPLLERLIKLNPNTVVGHKGLADIALGSHDWERAEKALTRLQQLCPLDPMSWRGLAGIYLERGEEDLAFPQLVELARTEPSDATIAQKVGTILWKRGELREAQYWLRQALAIDPFDVKIHEFLGDLCTQVNDHTCALREYGMLTKLEPAKVKHFEAAALAAQKLGNAAEARKFAKQAVNLDPASPVRSLSSE